MNVGMLMLCIENYAGTNARLLRLEALAADADLRYVDRQRELDALRVARENLHREREDALEARAQAIRELREQMDRLCKLPVDEDEIHRLRWENAKLRVKLDNAKLATVGGES